MLTNKERDELVGQVVGAQVILRDVYVGLVGRLDEGDPVLVVLRNAAEQGGKAVRAPSYMPTVEGRE